MLPSEREQLRKNQCAFENFTKEALDKAYRIVWERTRTRDVDSGIWEHFPLGLAGYVTLIFAKAARLISMSKYRDRVPRAKNLDTGEDMGRVIDEELEASIDEELLDIINYCSFAWAYRRVQDRQRQPIGCTKGAFGDALVSCLCPKCRAERAQRNQEGE